jgi:hypothetical protein
MAAAGIAHVSHLLQTLADARRPALAVRRAEHALDTQHRTLRAAANNAQAAQAARAGSSRCGDAGCDEQASAGASRAW